MQGVRMARGTALVAHRQALFAAQLARAAHRALDAQVTYYLNPKQVSDQARVFPQFETINPLGLTITEFHENRIGVDPIHGARKLASSINLAPGTIAAPTLPGADTGAIR